MHKAQAGWWFLGCRARTSCRSPTPGPALAAWCCWACRACCPCSSRTTPTPGPGWALVLVFGLCRCPDCALPASCLVLLSPWRRVLVSHGPPGRVPLLTKGGRLTGTGTMGVAASPPACPADPSLAALTPAGTLHNSSSTFFHLKRPTLLALCLLAARLPRHRPDGPVPGPCRPGPQAGSVHLSPQITRPGTDDNPSPPHQLTAQPTIIYRAGAAVANAASVPSLVCSACTAAFH
jgi:hypothetical protein